MRKLITHFIKALPLLALLFSIPAVNAQRMYGPMVIQDFETSIHNVIPVTTGSFANRQFSFDLYLLDTDPSQQFILAGYQAGIYINPAIFPAGAVITVGIFNNATYSELVPSQRPTAIQYEAATNTIKMAGQVPPGPGTPIDETTYTPNGTIISTVGNGSRVCRIRVTSSVVFTPNSLSNLMFKSSEVVVPDYATRVAHYDDTNMVIVYDAVNDAWTWSPEFGGTPPLNVQLAVIPGDVGATGTNAHVYENPPLNPATCTNATPFDVTGSGAYCVGGAGLEVGLSGSQNGVIYTLNPGGDLVVGNGQPITFGIKPAGTYTVTGVGTIPEICTVVVPMTGSAIITTTPLPVATITPSGSTTFCVGGSVDLTASAADSYLWSTGATTQSITVSASGIFTVTVTTGGCSDISDPVSVTVNPVPVAVITPGGATTFCQGGSVELTASAADSYLWSTGATTQSITVSGSGIFTVTVTTGGCSDISDPVSVTVNPYPVAVITPGGATTFCQGGSVLLTASAGDSYLWSTGAITQSITVSASGIFTVTVTTGGCSDISDPVSVTVNPAVTPSVTVVANPSGAVLTGTLVEFTATPINGGAAPTYEWWVNGISVSTANPFSYVPANGDGVYVVMTSNAECLTTPEAVSDLINMIVTDVVMPPAVFNVTGGGSYCFGTGGLLVGLDGSEIGVTYTMMPGSVVLPGTGNVLDFGYQLAGTYTISGTNSNSTVAMNGSAVIVEIPVPVPAVSIVVDNNDICGEATITFTATPVDGGTAPLYQWYRNTLPVGTNSGIYSYGPAVNGDDVYVTMASSLACAPSAPAASNHIIMSISTAVTPDVSIVASANNVIAGTLVTFTATPVNGGAPAYAWFVNGLPAGTNNFEFTYAPANGDVVQVQMTSSLVCVTNPVALSNIITMVVLLDACPATTWTGLVDEDWFNAGNWDPCVPQAITNVTIPAGCPHYPTLTAPLNSAVICVATINNLTLTDASSLIGQQYLCVMNDVVVERTIENSNFHLISSPVADITFGDIFLPAYYFEVWAREYNEPSGDWVNRLIADHLSVGQGYSVQMTTAPQTATFTGMLNGANVMRTLSNVNPGTDLNRIGWNLLGNPFPSAIDWDAFSTGDYDAQVAVWDQSGAGNYIYWNGTLGSLTDGLIPAQNGFFVKTSTDGAIIEIPTVAQTHFIHALYKNSVANALELRADGNNYYDAAFVHFNSNATSAFDSQYDAFKLEGLETAPQFYSMSGGYNLSINELPFEGNEVVNMGFKCGVAGTYNITASGMESFSSSTPILLEDLKLNTIQDLRLNPVYSFGYATSDNDFRFKLHFKNATGIDNPVNSGITVYSFDHTVVINNTTGLAGEVRIFDLTGRELKDASMSSSTTTRILMQAAIGTYIVKVTTAQGSVNQKVFIK